MSFVMFVIGLFAGAAGLAALLVPRLRAAVDESRRAGEAERAAAVQLQASEFAHERRLADLRAATEEKLALVSGNRERFAEQMKAISSDATRQISDGLEQIAKAQREAD